MIEVYNGLFVGNERDYEGDVRGQPNWRVVHACKEPYHRRELGYSGRAASKTHPEYLFARRGDRLILNLVDAPDPTYIPKEVVDAALDFIDLSLNETRRVLVHCNEGGSRAPSIAFLYLVARTERFVALGEQAALTEFRSLYPAFNPAAGMLGFIRANFPSYCRRAIP